MTLTISQLAMVDDVPPVPSGDGPAPNKGAAALRAHRKAAKESQTEFGARYGIGTMTISRYETGMRTPDVATALRFERDGICNATDWAMPVEAGE